MKALIQRLSRPLTFPRQKFQEIQDENVKTQRVAVIWNGMIYENNCLLDSKSAGGPGFAGDDLCPKIPDSLSDLPLDPPNKDPPDSDPGGGLCNIRKRQNGAGGEIPECGTPITYSQGPASSHVRVRLRNTLFWFLLCAGSDKPPTGLLRPGRPRASPRPTHRRQHRHRRRRRRGQQGSRTRQRSPNASVSQSSSRKRQGSILSTSRSGIRMVLATTGCAVI